MKVLCEIVEGYSNFKDIMDSIRYVSTSVSAMANPKDPIKPLIQTNPDLLIMSQGNFSPEVKAYCDKNKTKTIIFGDSPEKYADIIISKDPIDNVENNVVQKMLPNMFIKSMGSVQPHLQSEVSVLTNANTNDFYLEFLAKNYNVKIYGNKRINSYKYLGAITEGQRASILKSSRFVIDMGSFSYLDAIMIGAYPFIMTDMELPDTMTSFNNLNTLIECVDSINTVDYSEKLQIMQKELYDRNNITFTIAVLNKLNFIEEANKLQEIRGTLV